MKSQLSLVPKFSLLLVNERHELCIYIWPYEKKLARNNFYFEPILLGLFMGWQIKKNYFQSYEHEKFIVLWIHNNYGKMSLCNAQSIT